MQRAPSERRIGRVMVLPYICPLCGGGKQHRKSHCPDCLFAIAKLQELSHKQLASKVNGLKKELALIDAALNVDLDCVVPRPTPWRDL